MRHVYYPRIVISWDLQQIPIRGFKRDDYSNLEKCTVSNASHPISL